MTKDTNTTSGPAIKRYKIGYHTDEWGVLSSTPGGIADPAGQWVRYEDHLAALASHGEAPARADMQDAYVGAREDLAIWKRRALEAERDLRAERETASRLAAEINAINGPTHLGEPAPTAQSAPAQAAHSSAAQTANCTYPACQIASGCGGTCGRQLAQAAPAHPACKPDILVNTGALKLALNVLRRAGKDEVADELEKTAQPSPTHQADSQPAPDEIINMAREQGLPETEIEGVFRVNVDDLGRMFAADRAARAPADSVTAPVGGETYHLGACIVEDMLHATVMRKEPGRAGAVTVLLSEQIPVEHLQDRDVIVNATPPAQAADSVLEDAARYRYLRDGDWREHEKLESVIRLQLNTLWDETIDAARAAQESKSHGN